MIVVKLAKYWKVELFGKKTASVTAAITGIKQSPFFVGYAAEPLDMRRYGNDAFISLHTQPDEITTKTVRVENIEEVVCTPVYECESSFNEAAEPLIKWLAENVHPHHSVIVTSTSAELLQSEKSHLTEKFLVD